MKLNTPVRLLFVLAVVAGLLLMPSSAAAQPTNLVWRLQIRLITGNVNNAGTDDSVSIRLNNRNLTWLDYGRNDWERRDDFTYDLQLNGVRTIDDIAGIQISKTGSDGWCVRALDLLVNGRSIYATQLGSPCLWLDNDSGHQRTYTVNGTTLRRNPAWRTYRQPFPPFVLPRAEIESRLESMVGHYLTSDKLARHDKTLYWGHLHGRAVEVSKVANANNAIHVDLDLAYDVSLLPDPEVDVDFDLYASCSNGVMSLTTRNVSIDVDSRWYSEILGAGLLVDLFGNQIGDLFESGLEGIRLSTDTHTGFCPKINVQSNGSILFSLS